MIESGTLGQKFYRGILLAVCALLLCSTAWAQSEDNPVPLGDVARSLRKKKEQPQAQPEPAPAHTIIDNDNFSQVLDEVESRHITRESFLYSFDTTGKTFEVSAPDVTCSLSFTANAAALLSRSNMQIDLPEEEVRKLNGPATINEEGLQVSVFNGTDWRVEEIIVGLTIVQHPNPTAGYYGTAKLRPAASETALITEKAADLTTLHRLVATSLPSATTIFKAPLSITLAPDQEWHWAIVRARGIPPRPENSALKVPLSPTTNAVIP